MGEPKDYTDEPKDYTGEVKNYTGEAKDYKSEVGDYMSEVKDHTSEVGDYTSEVKDHTSEHKDHTSEVKDHTSEVGDYTSEVKDHTSEHKDHMSEVGDYAGEVKDYTGEPKDYAGEADTPIDDRVGASKLSENVHIFLMQYTSQYPLRPLHLAGDYFCVKVIRNPYARAISILSFATHYIPTIMTLPSKLFDLNAIEFFRIILDNDGRFIFDGEEINILSLHIQPQYVIGEEEYITKYLRVEDGIAFNKSLFGIERDVDIRKITARHYVPKEVLEDDFSHTPLKVFKNFPRDSKLFYNAELKQLIEEIYKKDIERYGYTFEEKW
jgi:hypothetical protein